MFQQQKQSLRQAKPKLTCNSCRQLERRKRKGNEAHVGCAISLKCQLQQRLKDGKQFSFFFYYFFLALHVAQTISSCVCCTKLNEKHFPLCCSCVIKRQHKRRQRHQGKGEMQSTKISCVYTVQAQVLSGVCNFLLHIVRWSKIYFSFFSLHFLSFRFAPNFAGNLKNKLKFFSRQEGRQRRRQRCRGVASRVE